MFSAAQSSCLAGFVALLLSACATAPTSLQAAKPVAQTKIFAFTEPAPAKGSVTIVRDSGFTGSGCDVLLSVDDQPAAQLAASEMAQLHMEPGEHIFGVRYTGGGMCGLDKNLGTQREFTVKANQARMLRVQLSPAIDILPMTSDQANAQRAEFAP